MLSLDVLFTGMIERETVGDNEYIILRGDFGTNFPTIMSGLLKKEVVLGLFKDLDFYTMSFKAYFALEVYELLRFLVVDTEYNKLPFNRKVIDSLKNKLRGVPEVKTIQHTDDGKRKLTIKEASKDIVNSMNFGVLDHQLPAFEDYFFMKKLNLLRGKLLFAEPGTGKTFMSLALAIALKSDRIIIICPSNTVENVWLDSLVSSGMFKNPQDVWTTADKPYYFDKYGKKHKKKHGNKYIGQKYIVAHYEYIVKLNNMIHNDGGHTTFIIDESHNLNNKDTRRTDAIAELLNKIDPQDVILLSGTPIIGKTIEVSNILKYIDPRFNKDIETTFGHIYKSPGYIFKKTLSMRYTSINTFIPASNMNLPPKFTLPELITLKNGEDYTIKSIKKRMGDYALDKFKEYSKGLKGFIKTYEELRDKSFNIVKRNRLTNDIEFKEYKEDIKEIIFRYEHGGLNDITPITKRVNLYEKDVLSKGLSGQELKDFRHVKSIVKYISLKIQGEVLASVVMRSRIDLGKDLAKVIDYKKFLTLTPKKLLMFSAFGEVCQVAEQACGKVAKTSGIYWDSTTELDSILKDFHDNPETKALVGTFMSIGTGNPITCADITIYFDLPYKAITYSQSMARTRRKGQDKPCYYYQIQLDTGDEPNINTRGVDIIEASQEIVESITTMKMDIDFKRVDIVGNLIDDYDLIKTVKNLMGFK